MSAIAMGNPQQGNLQKWTILLGIFILISALTFFGKEGLEAATAITPADVQITEISHAVQVHGADALAVRTCLKNNGARQIWQKGNKFYFVCRMPDGKWGLQVAAVIDGKLQEITAFIKENYKSIEQMSDYLRKGGAKCIKGGFPWVK